MEFHESKREYTLHFTVSEFSVLFLDILLNPNTYGEVAYITITENDTTRAYLTKRGMQETYTLSKKMLDKEFADEIIADSERLDRRLLAFRVKDWDDTNAIQQWKEIVRLLNTFSRLYRFYEQPFQQALERVLWSSQNIPKEKMIDLLEHHAPMEQFDLSEKENYVLDLLTHLGHKKLQLHKNMEILVEQGFPAATKFVAKKYGVSTDLVSNLRKGEFDKALKGESQNWLLAEKRRKGYAFVRSYGKWVCYHGKQFHAIKQRIDSKLSDLISGTTASRGIVRGLVIMHLSWTRTTDIPKGAILVTGMTNPQMVPFIKNAAAIVTDEGGLTCHAAIISREMGIPCIVGTGNATQVLKDGDLVEVDADKGVVRVIKSEEE